MFEPYLQALGMALDARAAAEAEALADLRHARRARRLEAGDDGAASGDV